MTAEEWTCGHTAGAMCQECYRLLAERAHVLAEQNLDLSEQNIRLNKQVSDARNMLLTLKQIIEGQSESWLALKRIINNQEAF